MKNQSPATIVDVARKAGVSTATVSRAINGVGPVSDETDTRVREAIAELNYTRRRKRSTGRGQASAPAPAATTARLIAFLKLGPFDTDKGHTMTDAVIEGLDKTARAMGRQLSVSHVPDLKQVEVRDVVGDAAGVVIRISNEREMIEQALEWLGGMPAVRVLGENRTGRTLIDHVTPDNAEVGALAAEYLVGQGCRRVVFASTSADSAVASERCISFVRAAVKAGVSVSAVILDGGTGVESLAEELAGLSVDLRVEPDRADLVRTVAAVNDGRFGLFMPRDLELAMVMPQLQVIGIGFGKKAVAIGCDNETRCLMELEPRPASIDLHVEDVARRAIRRLCYRIEHPHEPRVRVTVAPDIVRPTV